MKIKRISCDQFAGLLGQEISFEPGLNLVVGENESGKSTLVDLIYQLYFQGEKVRKGSSFQAKYYPKNVGREGNTIDGTIQFDTDKGSYKLTKEWVNNDGSSKLVLPDGTVIRKESDISPILEEVLQYGKGVYDELVFASQRREQAALKAIFGEKVDKDKAEDVNDLSNAILRTVMESGGTEIKKLEEELADIIRQYDERWDFRTGLPENGVSRGIENRWSCADTEKAKAGKQAIILRAYYEKESIRAMQKAAEDAETSVEECEAAFQEKKKERDQRVDEKERFERVRVLLVERAANEKLLRSAQENLGRLEPVLREWPELIERQKKAAALKTELSQAESMDLYKSVKGLVDQRDSIRNELDQIGQVDGNDVQTGKSLEEEIREQKSLLKGMDISAHIKPLGDAEVQVKAALTGTSIDIGSGRVDIKESVDILVPGVVEIELAPNGIDVDVVRGRIDECRRALDEIFKKYRVESVDELIKNRDKYKELSQDLQRCEERIGTLLGSMSWEALKAEVEHSKQDSRALEIIRKEIELLCGHRSVESFADSLKDKLDGYQKEFGGQDQLAQLIETERKSVNDLRNKLEEASAIPEEFTRLRESPDDYAKHLSDGIKALTAAIDGLQESLNEAKRKLKDKSAEEYSSQYAQAEEIFESKKNEYARWKHIQDVFLKVKDAEMSNPMEDIEDSFRSNLSILSDGGLALESVCEDLGSTITSGRHKLNAAILSDGTKDTISLAFRLAVLKHLYPDGGCVAIFDDPFTDMDPKRTERACKLIEEFAERNQVIFVTCDEKYRDMLHGNLISLEKQ